MSGFVLFHREGGLNSWIFSSERGNNLLMLQKKNGACRFFFNKSSVVEIMDKTFKNIIQKINSRWSEVTKRKPYKEKNKIPHCIKIETLIGRLKTVTHITIFGKRCHKQVENQVINVEI